jgi:hypothetical protein
MVVNPALWIRAGLLSKLHSVYVTNALSWREVVKNDASLRLED